MTGTRKDRVGEHRTALEKNKRIIFQTQNTCGICGLPVDMSLKYPDPMSKTVDHIIPIAKGGHPSDLANLQLAHRYCNRQKSDRLFLPGQEMKCREKENRDPKTTPASKKTQGINDNQRSNQRGSGQEEISNDDLPLHADWAELIW